MARLFDAGQFATGFIAVGQFATGFVAIGQVATGVIAIGQVARGGIVIGMVGFGLWSISMVGVGVLRTTALIGVGGTAGFGLVLPLIPLPARRPRLPPLVSADALVAGAREAGWTRAWIEPGPEGIPVCTVDGERLAAPLDARLRPALAALLEGGAGPALVHLRRDGARLRWDRVMALPRPARANPALWIRGALGLVVLAVIAFVYWWLVALPLGELLRGPAGMLR